jgi:hypothetical protein
MPATPGWDPCVPTLLSRNGSPYRPRHPLPVIASRETESALESRVTIDKSHFFSDTIDVHVMSYIVWDPSIASRRLCHDVNIIAA